MSAYPLLNQTELLRPFSDFALTFDDYIFFDFSLLNTQSPSHPFYWRLVKKKSLLEIGLDNPSGILLSFRIVLFSDEPQEIESTKESVQKREIGIPRFTTEFWDAGWDAHYPKGHFFDIPQDFLVQLGPKSLRVVLEPDNIHYWIDLPGRGIAELNADRQFCSLYFDDVSGDEMQTIHKYLSRNRL